MHARCEQAAAKLPSPSFDRQELRRGCLLFKVLDDAEIDDLLGLCRRVELLDRQTVCREGDPGNALYVVLAGKLKVCRQAEGGQEVILGVLEPGEVFGEMSLIDGLARSATVTAVEAGSLLELSRDDFLPFLAHRPHVAVGLLVTLSRRLREMGALVGDMRFLDLRSRLAKTLCRLAQQHGHAHDDGIRLEIVVSPDELGGMVGASGDSISQQLHAWEGEGIVSREGAALIVHHYDNLLDIVGMAGHG